MPLFYTLGGGGGGGVITLIAMMSLLGGKVMHYFMQGTIHQPKS